MKEIQNGMEKQNYHIHLRNGDEWRENNEGSVEAQEFLERQKTVEVTICSRNPNFGRYKNLIYWHRNSLLESCHDMP